MIYNRSFTTMSSSSTSTMAEEESRTYVMVKPDGVQRGLVGRIIQRSKIFHTFQRRQHHLIPRIPPQRPNRIEVMSDNTFQRRIGA